MKFELNTKYTVALENEINQTGVDKILAMMYRVNIQNTEDWKTLNPQHTASYLPTLPEDWSWSWKVERGEFAGKFPARIAKYFYKQHSLKVPDSFLTEVGNVARMYSSEPVIYTFDFVNTINWNRGAFGDAGSCYWGSHSGAKKMIAENGYAIRFFDDGKGFARAWLAPKADQFVVFNGYGFKGNSTYTIAMTFAHFIGMRFKKIELTNNHETGGVLWINGGIGYLIGASETIAPVGAVDLHWHEIDERKLVTCQFCEDDIDEDDAFYTDAGSGPYCEHCYYEYYDRCSRCDRDVWREDMIWVGDDRLCETCIDRYYVRCVNCDEYYEKGSQCGCEPEEPPTEDETTE